MMGSVRQGSFLRDATMPDYDVQHSRSSRSLDTDTVVRHLLKEKTCEEVDGFVCEREGSMWLYSCSGLGGERRRFSAGKDWAGCWLVTKGVALLVWQARLLAVTDERVSSLRLPTGPSCKKKCRLLHCYD
jgi:hypothetical protein